MNKIILTLMFAASTLCASAGNTNTNDTLVVTPTPMMHCEGCENRIKSNIRFVKGTKKIVTSVPDQTVTIIYNNKKTKFEDFVAAFKKIGYEIKKKD